MRRWRGGGRMLSSSEPDPIALEKTKVVQNKGNDLHVGVVQVRFGEGWMDAAVYSIVLKLSFFKLS